MAKKKHIAVPPEVHHQAKVNATIKKQDLQDYIAELVAKDTEKATPTTTKKGK